MKETNCLDFCMYLKVFDIEEEGELNYEKSYVEK